MASGKMSITLCDRNSSWKIQKKTAIVSIDEYKYSQGAPMRKLPEALSVILDTRLGQAEQKKTTSETYPEVFKCVAKFIRHSCKSIETQVDLC